MTFSLRKCRRPVFPHVILPRLANQHLYSENIWSLNSFSQRPPRMLSNMRIVTLTCLHWSLSLAECLLRLLKLALKLRRTVNMFGPQDLKSQNLCLRSYLQLLLVYPTHPQSYSRRTQGQFRMRNPSLHLVGAELPRSRHVTQKRLRFPSQTQYRHLPPIPQFYHLLRTTPRSISQYRRSQGRRLQREHL